MIGKGNDAVINKQYYKHVPLESLCLYQMRSEGEVKSLSLIEYLCVCHQSYVPSILVDILGYKPGFYIFIKSL